MGACLRTPRLTSSQEEDDPLHTRLFMSTPQALTSVSRSFRSWAKDYGVGVSRITCVTPHYADTYDRITPRSYRHPLPHPGAGLMPRHVYIMQYPHNYST
jgi:hypothetical protein